MSEPKGCPMPGACACSEPAPLPDEVADHLKFLRTYSHHPGITDAATALERMARENEQLIRRVADNVSDANLSLLNRIAELEASLQAETAKKLVANLKVIELEAEREETHDVVREAGLPRLSP